MVFEVGGGKERKEEGRKGDKFFKSENLACDCCYPSHTVWGKSLSAQRKLNRAIKSNLYDGIKYNSNVKNCDLKCRLE